MIYVEDLALPTFQISALHGIRGDRLVLLFGKMEVMALLPTGEVKIILDNDEGTICPAGEYLYMVRVASGEVVVVIASTEEYCQKVAALRFPTDCSETWLYWGKPHGPNELFVLRKDDRGGDIVERGDVPQVRWSVGDPRFTRHHLGSPSEGNERPTQLLSMPVILDEDLTVVGVPNWSHPDGEDS